ncbi:hypothetical protein C8R43DRAFT_1111475 [Mycena crocata]|nr:hypothetical protein C8R43DRAFT_1111475 [Mycena crocata]
MKRDSRASVRKTSPANTKTTMTVSCGSNGGSEWAIEQAPRRLGANTARPVQAQPERNKEPIKCRLGKKISARTFWHQQCSIRELRSNGNPVRPWRLRIAQSAKGSSGDVSAGPDETIEIVPPALPPALHPHRTVSLQARGELYAPNLSLDPLRGRAETREHASARLRYSPNRLVEFSLSSLQHFQPAGVENPWHLLISDLRLESEAAWNEFLA